jgi:hypothetical protein
MKMSVQLHALAALILQKNPGAIYYEAECVRQTVWKYWRWVFWFCWYSKTEFPVCNQIAVPVMQCRLLVFNVPINPLKTQLNPICHLLALLGVQLILHVSMIKVNIILQNLYKVLITVQQDATMYSLLYFCKLLYIFWVETPPIIRSTYNC